MADVVSLERTMPASASRVFEMITLPENMVRWWGHEHMIVPSHNLDFTQPGPWHAVMEQPDGTQLLVSGEVTDVEPPRFIAFTWGWHDGGPGGPRGTETKVTIEISAAGENQAKMILRHFDLATDASRAGHSKGWLSVLDKLEKGLA